MLNEMVENFKTKIKNEPVFGVFSKTTDTAIIECIGYAGFDYVILDLEHGPNSVSNLQNLITASEVSGILPIVRVKEEFPALIGSVLDIGAAGVQIPQIRNSEDAKKAIEASRFYPSGNRGVCRFVRAANYSSMDKNEYFKAANNTILILQLEGEEALSNIDSIIEIQGYDIIFIGPYDLSQSLGLTGQVNHPRVIEKIKEIVDKVSKKNIILGIFIETKEEASNWVKLGVRYISYNVDVGLFYSHLKSEIDQLRKFINY
jgi:4-hydroxy-2-oxoheptanedioate aldolase